MKTNPKVFPKVFTEEANCQAAKNDCSHRWQRAQKKQSQKCLLPEKIISTLPRAGDRGQRECVTNSQTTQMLFMFCFHGSISLLQRKTASKMRTRFSFDQLLGKLLQQDERNVCCIFRKCCGCCLKFRPM